MRLAGDREGLLKRTNGVAETKLDGFLTEECAGFGGADGRFGELGTTSGARGHEQHIEPMDLGLQVCEHRIGQGGEGIVINLLRTGEDQRRAPALALELGQTIEVDHHHAGRFAAGVVDVEQDAVHRVISERRIKLRLDAHVKQQAVISPDQGPRLSRLPTMGRTAAPLSTRYEPWFEARPRNRLASSTSVGSSSCTPRRPCSAQRMTWILSG